MITNGLFAMMQSGGGSWTSLVFMGVLLVGLLLVMILPQKKREKEAKQMLESLKPGTRIRTIGGIYGTIVSVKEDYVTIVSGPDEVRLVFVKGAIATIENGDIPAAEEKGETEENASQDSEN